MVRSCVVISHATTVLVQTQYLDHLFSIIILCDCTKVNGTLKCHRVGFLAAIADVAQERFVDGLEALLLSQPRGWTLMLLQILHRISWLDILYSTFSHGDLGPPV